MSSTTATNSPSGDRDIAVSFSTRIALSKRDLIDEVVARENLTIRRVIEEALEEKWGRGA